MKIGYFVISLLLTPLHLWAQEAFVRDGNLFFKDSHGKVVQMTTSMRDSSPRLSPDGKSIVFVRDTPSLLVSTGAVDVNATELWLVNIETKKAGLLITGRSDPQIEKPLAGFESPRFSPDSLSIYFISAA